MQRYFIQPDQFTDETVNITGDDAHHLTRVMRSKPGDTCIVSDGIDREALVRLRVVEPQQVVADVIERLPMDNEPAVDVWVAQSLPKSDKMELVIQKGTEIGAAGFIPFVSERTVVQLDSKKEGKRLERWQKIAKEAAEQAHRNRVPAVESVLSWKELLRLAEEADAAWICYEKQSVQELRGQIRQAVSSRQDVSRRLKLLLMIGPEGGFSEREAEEAEAAGCRAVSLGKRILRTETAAMVGLTCILYETGEMGGEE
ncbi:MULTISPECIES: 16S rRNA (uracil(1498)-N(3))-methyltransferase [unclassified Paenibacillus]|uniref:16S rRNA (uracil(1498)-N(3))-methyltransferase n=1 Tax=unclassified Paenibacillus TaxID=185978 RepID=UPI001AE94366|nr:MULTISPECIES: 16S rRNA (uracil(1498)-N(3))-methyltransferase [unclassified Paenibacillus]MBP1156351.1 16S rRNA (uracil1498-N3)-methyltransferase [Paenibacillus sp. PvP091]MBP1168263.1 16S rRNA (uracil1498-N3)-methyltransferase [Paenibacillus sp. PvR098]MBP2439291.1 16S rRNA (uracil1498-N3)-methyltransferase [Paenibacillus sp. PvP052]